MTKEDAVIDPETNPVADGEEQVQDPSSTESADQAETATDEGTDWKSQAQEAKAHADEMESNFKGLQGTVQRLIEMQNHTASQDADREERALVANFNHELEGLTENEATFARRAFELELENRKLKSDRASNEPVNQRLAKDAILNKLSKDYGVSTAFLEQMVAKYNHPLAVAAAAEAAHATRKQLERPKANAQVEAASGGSAGGDEAELTKLANTGDWDAYWRLTDRQAERENRRR